MQTSLDASDPTPEPTSSVDGSRKTTDQPLERTVSTTTAASVTLVRIELHSTVDADLRVRVVNELDGPVLPPRREGLPAAGWDDEGFRGTVPASGRLGIGYACPVSATSGARTAVSDTDREPLRVDRAADAVSVELLGPAEDTGTDRRSVEATIRTLGRATPPADAVPVDSAAHHGIAGTGGPDLPDDAPDLPDDAQAALPGAVEEWLDAVESRLRRAERLTDASAEEATAALADAGGVDALSDLPEAVAADESTLRTAAARIDALAERAAATDARPVVSSLSRAADRERGGDGTAASRVRSVGETGSNGGRSADANPSNRRQSADATSSHGAGR